MENKKLFNWFHIAFLVLFVGKFFLWSNDLLGTIFFLGFMAFAAYFGYKFSGKTYG